MPATPLLAETERDPHSQRMLVHHGLLEGDLTPGDVRNARHAYVANCTRLDTMIGKLLDTLETIGLSRETAVLFTSDLGDMLGERRRWFKKHFFDHAARAPLIIHAPASGTMSGAPGAPAPSPARNLGLLVALFVDAPR